MRRGFTLPEVMIVMSAAVVAGALLLAIMVQTTGLTFQQSSKITQGLGLNDALAKIRQIVKQANAVASGFPEGPSPTFSSGPSTLVLKLPSIDPSANVLVGSFDYIVFSKDQDKLLYKLFPSAQSSRQTIDQILTLGVYSLLFQYFDTTGNETTPTSGVKVKVTLTLRQKTGVSFEVATATSEANLRND